MAAYIIMIIISFFASLLCLLVKENRVAPLIFFPFFLLLSAVVEYRGDVLATKGIDTNFLYNIFSTFEFVFYLFFFRHIFQNKAIKKNLLIVLILYVAAASVNIFFFEGRKGFHGYTFMLGCLLMVLFSVLYFYQLLRFPETGKLGYNPYFYIVTGLLFFNTCAFTVYGLNNFITKTMSTYNQILLIVSDTMNVLLYTLFTIGFLCRINLRKLYGSF